ncbi:hypothetical protein ACJW30_08G134700 [Castanea mollissima]
MHKLLLFPRQPCGDLMRMQKPWCVKQLPLQQILQRRILHLPIMPQQMAPPRIKTRHIAIFWPNHDTPFEGTWKFRFLSNVNEMGMLAIIGILLRGLEEKARVLRV